MVVALQGVPTCRLDSRNILGFVPCSTRETLCTIMNKLCVTDCPVRFNELSYALLSIMIVVSTTTESFDWLNGDWVRGVVANLQEVEAQCTGDCQCYRRDLADCQWSTSSPIYAESHIIYDIPLSRFKPTHRQFIQYMLHMYSSNPHLDSYPILPVDVSSPVIKASANGLLHKVAGMGYEFLIPFLESIVG